MSETLQAALPIIWMRSSCTGGRRDRPRRRMKSLKAMLEMLEQAVEEE